jgi:peptidoglycan/LPS O-acetylase OafA/YrhL
LTGQLLLLGSLLAALTLLSFVRVEAGRTLDRYLGNLTYPLYLYHEAVFVLVATVTVGYSYAVFSGAIVLSLLTAAVMMAAVDPMIDRYRDLVRGGRVGAVRSDADATTYPRPVAAR